MFEDGMFKVKSGSKDLERKGRHEEIRDGF
jgi:hypothetical protein